MAIMMPASSQQLPNVFDTQGMAALQARAKRDPEGSLEIVAKQFEAYFIGLMLKQARQSMMGSMMDSEQSKMFSGMYDQQLSLAMADRGGFGFADMLMKQLSFQHKIHPSARHLDKDIRSIELTGEGDESRDDTALLEARTIRRNNDMPSSWLDRTNPPLTPRQENEESVKRNPDSKVNRYATNRVNDFYASKPAATQTRYVKTGNPVDDFIAEVGPHAEEAARITGIPARFLIGHAALETGWGKHQIRKADGSSSFNLFGIKAGKSWNGEVARSRTTEYIKGVAQKMVEPFRAYSSYRDSFIDYANLLKNNPRYRKVLEQKTARDFAQSLQSAGYATDPQYAKKLESVILAQKLSHIG